MGSDMLPEGWEATTLGELFDFSNGVNADKAAYGKGIPFANVLEIITHEALIERLIPGRITLSSQMMARYCVRYGDILLNRTSETQEEVGLASVYLGHAPVVFGGFVFRGRPRTKRLEVGYSRYALRTHSVREQIVARGQGGIRSNIGQRDLKTVRVVLPSPKEQRAIARALDDAAALISKLERLIAKKQAMKQGVMQQLLTGKSRLPGFTDRWIWRPFDEVLIRLNAKRHQLQASSYETVGRLPVVDQGQKPIIGYTDRVSLALHVGDAGVIVFGDHTCITKFVDFDFAVGADGTQVLKATSRNSTRFMAYALIARPITSTGYSRHFKFLKEMAFPSPSIEEQHAIVRVLDEATLEIDALRRRLAKAKGIKQGMTQELLTGRTRLAAREAAS